MPQSLTHDPSHPGKSAITGMTGLEYVARLSDGSIPPPTMAQTFPLTLLPPEKGAVELRVTPDERALNPMKTVHGGWTMTMMDTAMALAAYTTLEPGEMCPTHETAVKFVRPISASAGVLRVTGHVLSRGRSVITVESKVEDSRGRVLAHGTSTCLIVRDGA